MPDINTVVVTPTVQVVAVNSSTPGTYQGVGDFLRTYVGTGSPEGAVTATVGSVYHQTDGQEGTIWWAKVSGTGNTGWRVAPIGDGRANAHRLMAKLTQNLQDAVFLFISDSTGGTAYWSPTFFAGLASRFPSYTVLRYLWDTSTGAYASPTTIQTGTGSNTLHIYSCAIPGANTATFLAPQYLSLGTFEDIAGVSPDYVMVSLGYNESSTPATSDTDAWQSQYLELLVSLLQLNPDAEYCVIGQGPVTGNDYQGERVLSYAKLAAAYGMGFIDVHQVFTDNGGSAALTVDGTHPNATGSALWAATVLQPFWFTTTNTIRGGAFPWLTVGEELLENGDFSRFAGSNPDGWGAGGSAVCSQDTTNYESPNGYAVKITTSGAPGYLVQFLDATRLKGKWVTLVARVYVGTGQPGNAGVIGLYDGVGTNSRSRLSSFSQGVFRWVVWQYYVDPTATTLNVALYGDTVSASGVATFDRVSLRVGRIPMLGVAGEAIPATQVQAGTFPEGTWKFGTNTDDFTQVIANGADNTSRAFGIQSAGTNRFFIDISGSGASAVIRFLAYDLSGTLIDGPLQIPLVSGGEITCPRVLQLYRLRGNGTSHVTGDYVLSSGWGDTATVTPLARDSGGRVSILCQGSGIGANPTVTLTWKDGSWGVAPAVVCSRGDVLATAGRFATSTPGATTCIFTFVGTPTTGETYVLDFVVTGK